MLAMQQDIIAFYTAVILHYTMYYMAVYCNDVALPNHVLMAVSRDYRYIVAQAQKINPVFHHHRSDHG